jgi:hypothetical protein
MFELGIELSQVITYCQAARRIDRHWRESTMIEAACPTQPLPSLALGSLLGGPGQMLLLLSENGAEVLVAHPMENATDYAKTAEILAVSSHAGTS